jgi:hypothetical protein
MAEKSRKATGRRPAKTAKKHKILRRKGLSLHPLDLVAALSAALQTGGPPGAGRKKPGKKPVHSLRK